MLRGIKSNNLRKMERRQRFSPAARYLVKCHLCLDVKERRQFCRNNTAQQLAWNTVISKAWSLNIQSTSASSSKTYSSNTMMS